MVERQKTNRDLYLLLFLLRAKFSKATCGVTKRKEVYFVISLQECSCQVQAQRWKKIKPLIKQKILQRQHWLPEPRQELEPHVQTHTLLPARTGGSACRLLSTLNTQGLFCSPREVHLHETRTKQPVKLICEHELIRRVWNKGSAGV